MEEGLEIIDNLDQLSQQQTHPRPGSPPPMNFNNQNIDADLDELDQILNLVQPQNNRQPQQQRGAEHLAQPQAQPQTQLQAQPQ